MNMQINIRGIRVNTISTLGSLNVGKVLFAKNQSSKIQLPKSHFEDQEMEEEEIKPLVPDFPLPNKD
ncbi:hypothetical protein GMD78_09120 [Ornithinibacillus sp. L9]|uniref:Uncharacterized protein n=1 Tax=Ornithinibacillus caprae TaxID=2678566 RepID=A0A6N8FL79_9BACI|nr:hypothetical protein [Ornithinibacillus caprae]MUK88549.1 hypothetical protein [Ornithinibacillus caprae]